MPATLDPQTAHVDEVNTPPWRDLADTPQSANILPAFRDFPENLWVNLPGVPVFAEHETTTKSGRQLRFGRNELNALAANCNRRIEETGDYAGVAVGHTPENSDSGPTMPLVGLAGPFRMGLIRQPNGKSKWAILADLHIQRDQADVIRRYPRRSAELWVEDAYEDMCLDPIALLGAEAPRLGMGLLYSGRRHGGGRRREVQKYQAKGTGTMNASDLEQALTAIGQLDWVAWIKSRMQGESVQPMAEIRTPEELAKTYAAGCENYARMARQAAFLERYDRRSDPAAAQSIQSHLREIHRGLVDSYTYLQKQLRPTIEAAVKAAKFRAARGEVGAFDDEMRRRRIPRLSLPPAAFV